MKKQYKLALVLSGGVARGLSHVGVLKVLHKEGIKIDLIVGSSVGALIGALYASGIPIKEIENYATTTRLHHFFDLRDFLTFYNGFCSGGKLIKRFDKYLGNKTFDDLNIKLLVPVIDLTKKQELVLDSGLVKDAVRAGISMPFFFKPYKYKNMILIDGGILNHLPIDIAKKYAKHIIAVDIPRKESFNPNRKMTNVVLTSYSMMSNKIKNLKKSKENNPDILIIPDVDKYNKIDFLNSKKIIRQGELATIKEIPKIKKIMNIK